VAQLLSPVRKPAPALLLVRRGDRAAHARTAGLASRCGEGESARGGPPRCVDKGIRTYPKPGKIDAAAGGAARRCRRLFVSAFSFSVYFNFHMHPAPSAPACLHVRAVCPWNGANFVPAMAFSTTSRIFFGAALALAVLALAPSRASAAAHGKVFAKQADVSCGNGGAFQPAHSRRPCTLPCATVRLPSFARGGGAEPRLWLFCFCVRSHLHAHVHAHAHIQSTRMHAHACDHC